MSISRGKLSIYFLLNIGYSLRPSRRVPSCPVVVVLCPSVRPVVLVLRPSVRPVVRPVVVLRPLSVRPRLSVVAVRPLSVCPFVRLIITYMTFQFSGAINMAPDNWDERNPSRPGEGLGPMNQWICIYVCMYA